MDGTLASRLSLSQMSSERPPAQVADVPWEIDTSKASKESNKNNFKGVSDFNDAASSQTLSTEAPTEESSVSAQSISSCNKNARRRNYGIDIHGLEQLLESTQETNRVVKDTNNVVKDNNKIAKDNNKTSKKTLKKLQEVDKKMEAVLVSRDGTRAKNLVDENARKDKEIAYLRKKLAAKREEALKDRSNDKLMKANQGEQLHEKVKASKQHVKHHSKENKDSAVVRNNNNTNARGRMVTKPSLL